MKIEIEIEPIPNPRPRFSGGRCYEPARIKKFKTDVGIMARQAMKGKPPFNSAVKVVCKFYRKYKETSRKFGDADNLLKSVMDALNKICWEDDSQIISCTAEKYQSPTPKIEIEVVKARQDAK